MEDEWAIGIVDAPVRDLVDGLPHDRVQWIRPPPGAFLADPMVLPAGSAAACRPTVLAEGFWFSERRGKIVAVDLGPGGSPEPGLALERAWHLSYPFLFRYDGETYCLPEMAETRLVQLFRANAFPETWVEDAVLLRNFAGIDPTLHHDGERFWLFCADRDDAPNAKLHLFHSQNLRTGWQPHPCNPVRCDLRNSRPAGPLFRHEDMLWRPAQDCSETYGGAVVLNRVLELTPTRFHEEPVVRLAPDPNGARPDGLHTLSPAGPITIIDGKRQRLAPSRLLKVGGAAWRKGLRARLSG
jgi:hypothetical protein